MSTYCRITGRSRGLPKPNYFPLLPPISPADAKRLCRITGKSYGLPTHHYIPVLVGFTKQKHHQPKLVPCHITTKADGQEPHHYYPGVEHTVLKEYKYIFPKLETASDLTKILESKSFDDVNKYVYTVDEHKCSLVFPGRLEAAVRDGDVCDVMLAKTADTLLIKLRRGQSVEVDVEEISVDGIQLYEGEGPNAAALQKRKKRKKIDNEWRRKIFEDKEEVAEYEQKMSEKRPKRMKVKLSAIKESDAAAAAGKTKRSWKSIVPVSVCSEAVFGATVGMVCEQINKGDLNSLINRTDDGCKPLIKRMPKALKLMKTANIDLSSSLPGIIQQPTGETEKQVGFPVVSILAPFEPLITSGFNEDVQHAIKCMNRNKSELTKMAEAEKNFVDMVNVLPKMAEIPEIVSAIEKVLLNSTNHVTENNNVRGLEINIGSERRFVPGEVIETSSGPVFVPGGTMVTSEGISFVPGFRVSTADGPKFLPGQIVQNLVKDHDDDDVGQGEEVKSVFVAGQTIFTRDGEKFVHGQTIQMAEGSKFLPGQTVLTPDGPAFIPGQIIEDANNKGSFKFVPGQTVTTPDGPQFVSGQFSTTSDGSGGGVVTFTAGRTILNEECNWQFVPGQTLKTVDGSTNFIPGLTVTTKDGRAFIPGLVTVVDDDSAEECFVPGIIVENHRGVLSFVAGMNVNTDNGQKFVEGLLAKAANGEYSFVAGKVSKVGEAEVEEEQELDHTDGSIINFNAASKPEEIILHDVSSFGLLTNKILFPDNVSNDGDDQVFGHMVQSSQGVEFFPGDVSAGLPAGKVVPGRLVRGKEIRFIPGNMISDKFVPGQVVVTDKGEQFIPGQVIETNEGPKFVPGQVLETKSGPKFVPGQTVDTEEGPRFVPGQIVNTKAGPTFIPGQVIHTDEEGSRFVPGQVVDTAEGPRFVPGKVIETGDHVTFIPGQIVETEDGLKFIAPDLEDDPEGGCQFTVQGFEVTPEELKMLQRNSISHALFHSFEAEPAIDSTMLQQLANAGMAIGREVPVDVPVIDIKSLPITEMACKVGEKLKVDTLYSVKLSHIFSNIQQLVVDGSSTGFSVDECEDDNLKILLKAVGDFSSDKDILTSLANIMEEIVTIEPERKLEIIDMLHAASGELVAKKKMRKMDKLSVLRQLVRSKGVNLEEDAINTIVSILHEEEFAVSSAFQHISRENPELIGKLLSNMAEMLESVVDEQKVTDTIHRAIIKTVVEDSENSVQEVLHNVGSEEFKCLVMDAIGLAKALGMTDIARILVNVLSDSESVDILARDKITLDVLKRLTIMRQLANKRPHLGRALHDLQSDPYSARKDPRLKELVRESAALMVVPEESVPLKSSEDIPASLLFGDNSLAMEDFMIRTRRHGNTFLILKQGLQAVIPREAARSVLTGRVSYTVLDDNGIHHFKPLHVFSALKLPRFATNRFSMYGYSPHSIEDDDSTIMTRGSSVISFDDMHKSFENGCSLTEEVNY